MVLVCDNALYHHKQKIGSLASISKKKLIQMMEEYEVNHIDLPLTTSEREEFAATQHESIEDRGDFVRIPFSATDQQQVARASMPHIGNLDELKISFVTYLKDNKPDLLNCIVENKFNDEGYEILWTPPYCPDLQPIELYWAAGKNWAAINYEEDQKMSETIRLLCEGWYGTGKTYQAYDIRHKEEIDCSKLWAKSLGFATTKFVPICQGISGTMGELQVDENYVAEPHDLPIDTLVLDFANNSVDDNETGVDEGEGEI